MAILAFQKPDKVIMLEATDTFGRFEFRPLEPGYATTIGNALRRILLSSLEGYALTYVKIDRVEHEFATIPGVMENVVDIILNLKQVRFKRMIEDIDEETVRVTVKGKETFVAADISRQLSSFQVLNPDLVICNMDPSVTLSMELHIGKGRGYVPAEENRIENAPFGLIAMDSIYTPIKNVNFSMEYWRVEQKTDYEKLILEVTTDGSIHPKNALKEAAKILIHHFMLFSDERISLELPQEDVSSELDEESLRMRQLLLTKLSDMEISVRALNCLKAAEIETFADLVSIPRHELMKFRNFGKKSLTEIDMLMERLDLSFGIDVTKYNIEKKVRKHETQKES
ncbi:MAG TPA: DNA-directed RNA polymerase subunit alpha [Bacteroidales bacterium]|nr:DNA-directed RNA polymerase subunit alpha [Bacteroidales bacterium]OQB70930.1 MAG: DNA-directed RNA polymerase subunit alpha [Bacteroidetes bacterium ADurb.Bin139]HOG25021.1 DNA-directed RNA polymerase subunit alpha [Bacteroidales bacterium]HOR11113.1 DNA-directed RNA polymerase subunit alpha [Bacteroidales bacterium]HOZ19203.1 DNA-directed RNA polymerase subunit alpha [Bacteroidales bacterium]